MTTKRPKPTRLPAVGKQMEQKETDKEQKAFLVERLRKVKLPKEKK